MQGVVSAEEVRGILREDERSGYNALAEEMEGESLPDEEDLYGDFEGSSGSSQDPFSIDEEPEKWITTKNNVHVPLDKDENKKEACKEFFEDKKQHQKDMEHSYEFQKETLNALDIDEAEYQDVVHGINKIYKANKNKKQIKYYSMGFIYKVDNHGFNNYKFRDKMISEEIDRNS